MPEGGTTTGIAGSPGSCHSDLSETTARVPNPTTVPRTTRVLSQGIIKYEEAFIEDSELIIVCEWASGGDLRRVIRRANEEDPPRLFSELEVWEHFLQVTLLETNPSPDR